MPAEPAAAPPAPARTSRWAELKAQWLQPVPLLLLGALAYLGYREYRAAPAGGDAAAPPPAAVDKAAEDLGTNYAKAIVVAPLAGLDAAANASSAVGVIDLAQAQSDARRAAQQAAYQPIADEATRRFGLPVTVTPLPGGAPGIRQDPQVVAAARSFFASVAAGYRKAVKP